MISYFLLLTSYLNNLYYNTELQMTFTLVKPSSSVTVNLPAITQLPSGLTIIAEQIPVEAINMNVWFNVGSTVESDEINGMAHFLEHMIFKGTPRLKSGDFERMIEERGAVTNAATSQEYTHFYITCAPKDFADLAPLQLDLVLHPTIPDSAFEKERLVVLEEIRRAEDNPRRRTFYHAMETCFTNLPYRRPILGPSSVIEQLTPQQMRDFHSYWYQPQSMTVAVVGNLPVDELISIVSLNITKDNSTSYLERKPLQPEPPFTDIVRFEYEDPSLQQARLVMMWRVPGLQEMSETYALDVLEAILGRGRMSRLFRDLREDRKLVSHISVSNMTHTAQGVFYISAQLPTVNLPEVEKAITSHLKQIQTEGITEKELNRIRTQVVNHFIFSNEKPSDRSSLYGYYHSQTGDIETALQYSQHLSNLTVSHIQEAACRYLTPDCYGIVISRPVKN
jgi:predicted Zn-dependent peptidase